MRRRVQESWRVPLALGFCLCLGCGRLGFDLHALAGDDKKGADPGALDASLPVDSGVRSDGSDGADAGNGTNDAGTVPDSGGTLTDSGRPFDDAALGTGLSCGAVAGALACTDFSGVLPAGVAFVTENGSLDATAGYVDARSNAPLGRAHVRATIGAQTSGTLYLRFRMQVASGFAISTVNFSTLAASGRPPDFGIDFNFVATDFVEVYTSGDGKVYEVPYVVPRDRWLCFLAAVTLGDGTGSVQMSIDGTELLNLVDIDTLPRTGVDEVTAGIDWTDSTQDPAQVLIDDFVLSTQPLGSCP